MSPQSSDQFRTPAQSYAEQWAAERFLGEAAEELESVVHPGDPSHPPFKEEQEWEEAYGSRAEEEVHFADLEYEGSREMLDGEVGEASELYEDQASEVYASPSDTRSDFFDSADYEQRIETAEPERSYEDAYLATEIFEQEFFEPQSTESFAEEGEAYSADFEDEASDGPLEQYPRGTGERFAGEDNRTLARLPETRRLQQAYFDSFVREAKALLDRTAEEVKNRDRIDMSEAEIEATLDRYQPIETLLPQGLGYYLDSVKSAARGVLTKLQPSSIQGQPVSSAPSTGRQIDLERAVRSNGQLAKQLGWQTHFDRIVGLLGFTSRTPDEREFALAVARWQRAQGLEEDGVLGPAAWTRMRTLVNLDQPPVTSGGLDGFTPAEERALRITNAFENTTLYSKRRDLDYGGLSGDFDGQGLSLGLLQWNIGTGSLQPLLKEFAQGHPQRFDAIFGTDAARLRQVLGQPRAEQLAWVRSINDYANPKSPRIKEPWASYFRQLAQEPAFRQIQLKHVRPQMKSATDYARRLGLRSERGLALMFDVVTQHGGGWLDSKRCHTCGTQTRRARIEQRRSELERQAGSPSEKQLLGLITNVIAETIGPRWRQDVLRRRMTIVDGQGTVHGHRFDLARDFGLTDRPWEEAATSVRPSPAAPPEAPPAPPSPQRTLSGGHWVSRFPTSKDVKGLEPTFRAKVERFIRAIKDGGGAVTVNSTYRPRERAYLMHWSWKIVKRNHPAQNVPPMAGVDIEWWHGDTAKSKQAAQEMVKGYGIGGLPFPPSLTSRHIEGKAIDMHVSWRGSLKIKNADGTERTISSSPRDETNHELIEVGKTYGVIHFMPVHDDRVHWSTDGR
jgi:hypothetical protein